jgi:hypothetical protein
MPNETEDTTQTTDVNQEKSQETHQDTDFTAKLVEYEQRLQELAKIEASAKGAEDRAKTAEAAALRWESSYKGLQKQTTQSLQAAAEDRRRLVETERTHQDLLTALGGLQDVRDSISALAGKMLDEDQAREFNIARRESALRREEDIAKQRQSQQSQIVEPAQSQQFTYTDPNEEKRNFLNYYFPDSGVDPTDPNIDWGEGATSQQEAFRRFTVSVTRIQKDSGQSQERQESQTEAEKFLAELKKEREEFEAQKTQALEEVQTQARKQVEERLRKLGVDSGSVATQSGSDPKMNTKLSEISEADLMRGDPASRKKAAKDLQNSLDAVRTELFQRYK